MRIALFSDNFYPEISGLADSIISLGKELALRGHEVAYFVPRYSKKNYALSKLPLTEPDLGRGIEIKRLFSFPFPAPTRQGRMVIPTGFRAISVARFNPDIIHTQLFFGVGFEGLIAAKVLRRPLIGTNHTAILEFIRHGPIRGKFVEYLMMKYVNWYYARCALTTAPSRSVTDEMKDWGFKGETHIMPNPIDTVTFHPIRHVAHLVEKFNAGDATVIHAGRLAPERNVDVIIRAVALIRKEIPNVKLLLAGHGTAENDLKALAKTLGIEQHVRFLGFLDKTTLNEAYNASRVFAITSTSDTQSMVMMQAMAAGVPIVGVKARALPEYITEHNGFVVEPGDHKALALKIMLILRDPELQRKLSHGARLAAEKFSAPEIAKEWEKIYEKVAADFANSRK